MASEKLKSGLNLHNPHHIIPDEFVCTPQLPPDQRRPSAAIDRTSKTSAAANFNCFQPHPPSHFCQQWNPSTHRDDSSDDDDGDDALDHDDDVDDGDDVEERNTSDENAVTVAKLDDDCHNNDFQKTKLVTALGVKEGNMTRESGKSRTNNDNSSSMDADRMGNNYRQYENYSTSSTQKDAFGWESCCGFSGRKEGPTGDSIRSIFSDPISGTLMDDAMILPCGHSFGSGGMQHIFRAKACYICSQPVSEDSIIPNLSLRIAVQAFKREEELLANRISKRRRERYDQDKGTSDDPTRMHFSNERVQFPFAVRDRVIIKGNKRTPPRFVGREAIVTTQCLNGWYVVKTLDNAESVKLQYRSLAKISDKDPSMKP